MCTDICGTEAIDPSGVVVKGVRDRAARDRVLKWATGAVAALHLRGLRVDFRGALRARRGWEAGASCLAARGRFFGVLTVAVTSRPERLLPSPDLLDRLAGVVAHPATALANGRLVDRITREARHDSLTGLASPTPRSTPRSGPARTVRPPPGT
jgi:hypothetical protein